MTVKAAQGSKVLLGAFRLGFFSQRHTLTQSGNYRLDAKIIKLNYLASVMQEARRDNIPASPLINDVPVCRSTE